MSIEIWKDIAGYEGSYQVSNFGRVRSVGRLIEQETGYGLAHEFYDGTILVQSESRCGYMLVGLHNHCKRKNYSVHRLVAKAFIQKVNGKNCVNHKDGNKKNNHVDNLEWCTYSENIKHAYDKLSKPKLYVPVKCVETGVVYKSARDAANHTGASYKSIVSAVNGHCKTAGGYRWEHTESYNLLNVANYADLLY